MTPRHFLGFATKRIEEQVILFAAGLAGAELANPVKHHAGPDAGQCLSLLCELRESAARSALTCPPASMKLIFDFVSAFKYLDDVIAPPLTIPSACGWCCLSSLQNIGRRL